MLKPHETQSWDRRVFAAEVWKLKSSRHPPIRLPWHVVGINLLFPFLFSHANLIVSYGQVFDITSVSNDSGRNSGRRIKLWLQRPPSLLWAFFLSSSPKFSISLPGGRSQIKGNEHFSGCNCSLVLSSECWKSRPLLQEVVRPLIMKRPNRHKKTTCRGFPSQNVLEPPHPEEE